jgi:hypothetical protein
MGISDFGQVSRLVSKRFQKGFWAAERLRAQIESCRESLLRMDFKSEARIEIMRAARKEKSYEMNKCLTLVHLTTNALRRKPPDTRFFWAAAEFVVR